LQERHSVLYRLLHRNNYFRNVGRMFFVISILAQMTGCRIRYFCKLRKINLKLILCNPILGDDEIIGGGCHKQRGRREHGQVELLSLVRRRLCIGTAKIPPSVPHPVLLSARENTNQQKTPQRVLLEKVKYCL